MIFETLGGRFQEAHELIRRSWLENKDQTIDFTAEFLASAYEYPGADPALSPAISEGGRLAAFVSAFPRRATVNGRSLELALLTFFTVAPELKGRGIGKAIWADCLRRICAAGYDGAIHYCVAGNKSNHVTTAAAREMGLESARVFTVDYLMRPVAEDAGLMETPCDESCQEEFARLAASLQGTVPFARSWTAAEIEWQCRRRLGAMTVREARTGEGGGILTGYFIRMASADRTRALLLEDVLWGNLTPERQDELIRALLARAARRADVIAVPLWGYAGTEAFRRARFRRSSRSLHVYLTMCNGEIFPAFDSMYIDVF